MISTNNITEMITGKSEGLHQSKLDSDVHGLNQAYWMYLQELARRDRVSEMPMMTISVAKRLGDATLSIIEKLTSSAHLTFKTTLQDETIKRIMDHPNGAESGEKLLCKIVTGQIYEVKKETCILDNPLYVMNNAYWFLFKRYAQNSVQDASERFRLSLSVAGTIAMSTDNQLRNLISSRATFKPLFKASTVSTILDSQDDPKCPAVLSRRLFDFLGYTE